MPVSTMDSFLKGIAGGTPAGGAIMDIISSGGSVGTGTGVRVGDLMLSTSSGVPPTVAPGGKVFAYPTLFYPSVWTTAQATPVTLGSGEERSGIDFQLKLVPTSRVSGNVIGPNGPMPNVAVRLVPAGSDDLANDSGLDVATTSTASDGTFTFLGVPLGQYTARVVKAPRPAMPAELASSPLMQLAFGGAAGAAGQPSQTIFAEVPVSVGTTDLTDVAIVLTEGTKASGHLEFDGALPRPTPQQLQAVNVTMTEADSHVAPAKSPTKVDAEGRFRVTGLSPGRYSVDTAGGLPGWAVQSVVAAGRDVTFDSFDVKDQDVTDIVVTFTDKRQQLSGIVRGVEGKPASVVTVLLFPVDFGTWIAGGMNVRGTRTVTAGKTGAFTLGNTFPGEYFVAALDDAELAQNDQDLGFFEALSRVAMRVTIAPGDKKTQNLQIVKIVR
jgi:hypothetical protein